jgi:uncharacterized RDD family membrane protein YckC
VNNNPTQTPNKNDAPHPMPGQNAGFFRRLGAIFYDSLLVIPLLMAAGALVVVPFHAYVQTVWGLTLYRVFLFFVVFGFFGWFWVHGGQTLGMRAWRLRLVDLNGERVSWKTAFKRYCLAWISFLAAGLGFLWILNDRERCAWHDRLSRTRVKLLPKPSARATQ